MVLSVAGGRSVRQAVNLGAAETQRLDLRAITQAAHLEGAEGGVSVLVPTGGGNLITSHIVFDETAGMSATMKTFERNGAEKPRLHTMRAIENTRKTVAKSSAPPDDLASPFAVWWCAAAPFALP
ncbi:MAG TPA: hypothetical protein VHU83_02960 [Bryobacteraceae bacterium]|nr:hypothetical protein [Bryobacteraceae bacterium]